MQVRPSSYAVSALIATLFCSACSKRLSDTECEGLLDLYTERLVLEERPETTAEEISRLKEEARRLAKSHRAFEFDRCPALVSRRQFECAMSAPSVDEMERCLTL